MLIRSAMPRSVARQTPPARRGVDSMLGEFWGHLDSAQMPREEAFAPPIDIRETAEFILFTAELPGLDDSDFEVLVEGDVLTIKGEKKAAKADDSQRIVRSESSCGVFTRSFQLPFEADPESVSGGFRNGVLTITVPRPESPQTRSIPISIS